MSIMVRFKSKKQKQIITTFDLGAIIQKQKAIPTPAYENDKEYRFIVQPRGSIFTKAAKRSKAPKF